MSAQLRGAQHAHSAWQPLVDHRAPSAPETKPWPPSQPRRTLTLQPLATIKWFSFCGSIYSGHFTQKELYNFLSSSVQLSHSVMSNSLWPHESQHARPPCPSPTPGVHSNSRPSSRWCHPAISSSVVPFFSCPQSLPASGSFPMSQLFTWGGLSS